MCVSVCVCVCGGGWVFRGHPLQTEWNWGLFSRGLTLVTVAFTQKARQTVFSPRQAHESGLSGERQEWGRSS